MATPHFLLDAEPAATSLLRAKVESVLADGTVKIEAENGALTLCDPLTSGDGGGLTLAAGDVVLVWQSGRVDERAVVMGRVGPTAATASTSRPDANDEIPNELVLEAKQSLTLRVGEGSITIREDGKILIKGKDLVSHAQRMNRIKGGAVSIN